MSGCDFTSCTALLSRRMPGLELLSAAAGLDRERVRVGERLRAALAGLHELHFLRERQSERVLVALRGDRHEASGASHAKNSETKSNEQRLEATLASLKQQLTRLRRQDVGLKTHLQQLDQQISELKLDVCKASTEHLESDSRPSSGFYELSDGGLGSLSNSCTSVYSECLSSSSQASLLPLSAGSSALHNTNTTHGQVDVSRRRSADESTAQPDAPRGLGIRLGSSGIRTTSVSSERARQRPVSTGDLDRMVGPAFPHKPAEINASSLYNHTLDTKYQNNLVSRNGSEVYRFPSPLHAVALQSPIFSLSVDQSAPLGPEANYITSELGFTQDILPKEEQPVGYIAKLLQRSSSKSNVLFETGSEKKYVHCADTHGQGLIVSGAPDIKHRFSCAAEPGSLQKTAENQFPGKKSVSQEQATKGCVRPEETTKMCHIQYPTNAVDHKPSAVVGTKGKIRDKTDEKYQSVHADLASKPLGVASKPPVRRPSFTSSNEENRSSDGGHTRAVPSEFVCAQFVPAGSQNVKVRQADKKTKAVKLRKKSNEKPPSKKYQQKLMSREHEKERAKQSRQRDRDMKQFGTEKERERGDGRLQEARLRSCSESSLLGPGKPYSTHLQPHHQQNHIPKSNKPQKAHLLDLEQPSIYQAKKKQKWPSASEIQLSAAVQNQYQRSKEMPVHRVLQKPCMARSISMRPRSAHWGGLAHPIQPSRSSAYFGSSSFGYPPAPLHTRYPPRCESEFSEYSAECASLFHSTIAESSEGELSDYTANRFGDSESSQESRTASDTDSSLSLDEEDSLEEEEEEEGGLVWAEAAMGPTAAGLPLQQQQQHHRPEPSACRIKASRALKKKIRRFQPASLKVMTLV